MRTECNQFVFGFHPLKRREIRAEFNGGAISSDGGGLLLREVEKRTGILRRFAACFTDYRNADLIEHTVDELVAQRVYGLAPGYEDLRASRPGGRKNGELLKADRFCCHPSSSRLCGHARRGCRRSC